MTGASALQTELPRVTLYSDPGCPYGFDAQRQELQLLWHYGHAVHVQWRMIVLMEHAAVYAELGMSPELIAAGRRELAELHGMPLDYGLATRAAATIAACRLFVGARTHAPDRALPLLRCLRRRAQSDRQPLDDVSTLHAAAHDAGLARETVDAWLEDPAVEEGLRGDMADAREPLPEALALGHRLSGGADAKRYSTSSALLEHEGRRIVTVGVQPFETYETAVANVAPVIERRDAPTAVDEVLGWAPFALATAEVAALLGTEIEEARGELQRVDARFVPSAGDGYWSAR